MTTFNTDYSNTELLDQELTTAELLQVSGGCMGEVENEPPNPIWWNGNECVDPDGGNQVVINGVGGGMGMISSNVY